MIVTPLNNLIEKFSENLRRSIVCVEIYVEYQEKFCDGL